jgi:hypothetical protein
VGLFQRWNSSEKNGAQGERPLRRLFLKFSAIMIKTRHMIINSE